MPQNEKPTKTRVDPFAHLDDLDALDLTGKAPVVQPKDEPKNQPKNEPRIKTASAADTQSRASINPSDRMRDMLNRIDMTQDDEIDDAEARVRAGHVDDDEPVTPNVPVRRQDLPDVLDRNLSRIGDINPEWHTINNLPGYMQRAIRGMGRQVFRMMTRTPLEDIMTIAHVEGQGPNSLEELKAVATWLKRNGEDLGPVEVGHGQAIPGYQPRANDFRAMGVRFHVVQDDYGHYIYAWPEQDSLQNTAQGRLERDVPRLPNRESIMNTKQALVEELRLYRAEKLMESQWTRSLLENLLDESTLSRMIGDTPGGQLLVRWMHRKHLLSNEASYDEHPFSERMMWTEFKNHPDNFLIISGSQGVAGIKPNEADIQRGYERAREQRKPYNPARDNTLRYQIVAFRKDGQVDPALLRDPREIERDADPTVMRARGGMPSRKDVRQENNIFDRLAEQIGRLQAIYITREAVEREKITGRRPSSGAPANLDAEVATLAKRVRPVLKKLGYQAISIVNNRAKRYIDGGNFEKAQEVARVGNNIKQFLTAIDTSGELNLAGYNNPIAKIFRSAINDASQGIQGQELAEWLADLNRSGAAKLGPILDAIRAGFMRVA